MSITRGQIARQNHIVYSAAKLFLLSVLLLGLAAGCSHQIAPADSRLQSKAILASPQIELMHSHSAAAASGAGTSTPLAAATLPFRANKIRKQPHRRANMNVAYTKSKAANPVSNIINRERNRIAKLNSRVLPAKAISKAGATQSGAVACLLFLIGLVFLISLIKGVVNNEWHAVAFVAAITISAIILYLMYRIAQ